MQIQLKYLLHLLRIHDLYENNKFDQFEAYFINTSVYQKLYYFPIHTIFDLKQKIEYQNESNIPPVISSNNTNISENTQSEEVGLSNAVPAPLTQSSDIPQTSSDQQQPFEITTYLDNLLYTTTQQMEEDQLTDIFDIKNIGRS